MRWTTNKPTKDGFYFVKCIGRLSGNMYETVVKVYDNCKKVFYDGDNYWITDSVFTAWSDTPIEPPTN
jgi:hypothetical protein